MTSLRSALAGLWGRDGAGTSACPVCGAAHDGIDPATKEPNDFCSVRCSLHDLLD